MNFSLLYFILNAFVLINKCIPCDFNEYGTIALTYTIENITESDSYKEWCENANSKLKVVPSLKSIALRVSISLSEGSLMKNMKDSISEDSFVLNNEEITYTKKGFLII